MKENEWDRGRFSAEKERGQTGEGKMQKRGTYVYPTLSDAIFASKSLADGESPPIDLVVLYWNLNFEWRNEV